MSKKKTPAPAKIKESNSNASSYVAPNQAAPKGRIPKPKMERREPPMNTPWQEELLHVPIEAVATLAASLLERYGTAAEATMKAYELLEYAAAGRSSLKNREGYSGVLSWDAVKSADMEWREADLGRDVSKTDSRGGKLPADFEEALASLMPRLKSVERMPRFRHWLIDCYLGVEAEEGVYASTREFFAAVEEAKRQNLSDVEAANLIATWKGEGIPAHVYFSARQGWPFWWKKNLQATRSQSGQKRRKKRSTDKRTGAKKGQGEEALLRAVLGPRSEKSS